MFSTVLYFNIIFLTIQLLMLIIFTIYKNKINFNFFLFFSFTYLFLIFTNLLSFYYFYNNKEYLYLSLNINLFFKFIYFNIFKIKIGFLQIYFIFIVTLISFFANILCFFYLNDDKKKKKFFLFLNFFTFSMILFILQDCVFLLILSWEFLGLTSFFLINHYENTKSLKSSMSAFFFNRLSDIPIFILSIIFLVFYNQQNLTDLNIFFLKKCIIICITTASFFKSAIIFFKWLPDSMEAPLPASALIHSATLVSAGIYLTIRYNNIYNN